MMFGGTKQAPATGGFCFGGTVLPSAPVLFGGAASESDNCDVTQGAAAVESQEATPDEIAPFSVADELTDVVLEVEGKELHVNRAVLAHYSPVFSRMFFGDFKEKDQTKVTLPGKSYVHFTTFLQVMYPQTTETPELISDENLVQILELAEEYQVDNVKIRCQDYIGEQLADYFAMYYRATKPGKQPASGSFVLGTPCSGSGGTVTVQPEELVSKMALYIWMCDQHGLVKHRANALSILTEHAKSLGTLRCSLYYDSLPPNTKVSILETLCRKFDGSSQRETGCSFPPVTSFCVASKQRRGRRGK